VVTGPRDADRKRLARAVETQLFDEGRLAYFIGIGNVLYGVDADLDHSRRQRHEHLRRLGEIANLMMEAGMLLVVTAAELTGEELDLLATTVDASRIHTVWLGDALPGDFVPDLALRIGASDEQHVARISELLAARDESVRS
jgi:bifunctional enzyme CysN/CysC